MARPPKPTNLLELTGAFKRNPQRARARSSEPMPMTGLGPPPPHFMIEAPNPGFQKAAKLRAIWHEIAEMGFWLTSADRHTVEDICDLRLAQRECRIKPGERGILARLNNACGLDPSGRVKVNPGPAKPTRQDPRDKYLSKKHG